MNRIQFALPLNERILSLTFRGYPSKFHLSFYVNNVNVSESMRGGESDKFLWNSEIGPEDFLTLLVMNNINVPINREGWILHVPIIFTKTIDETLSMINQFINYDRHIVVETNETGYDLVIQY